MAAGDDADRVDDAWIDAADDCRSPTAAAAAVATDTDQVASALSAAALAAVASPQASELLSPTSSSSSLPSSSVNQSDVFWQGRVVNVCVAGDTPGTLILSRHKIIFNPDDNEKPFGFWDRGRCSWCVSVPWLSLERVFLILTSSIRNVACLAEMHGRRCVT